MLLVGRGGCVGGRRVLWIFPPVLLIPILPILQKPESVFYFYHLVKERKKTNDNSCLEQQQLRHRQEIKVQLCMSSNVRDVRRYFR